MDEIDKLSKRDGIGPLGSLFNSKVAGIYLLVLVSFPDMRDCILTLDLHY